MNILVTGASGFLGFEIAKALKEKGHTVYNFSRTHTEELEENGIPTRKGDLSHYPDLYQALEGIDAVFHVAAKVAMWGKWEDFYRINVSGAHNMIKALKERGIKKLVFTSSPSVVFDKHELLGANESTPYPANSLSMYAKSKAMAEKYILESSDLNLATCALRPHLVFGKRDKNIIPRLVESRSKGKLKRIGNGDNLVDVIHVKNAVHAHLLAFDKLDINSPLSGEAYFIAQEKPVNLWDFIDQILLKKGANKVEGKVSLKLAYCLGALVEVFLKLFKIHNVHPPMTRFVALQMGTSHYFSHDKAKEHFNYEPILTIDQALEDI